MRETDGTTGCRCCGSRPLVVLPVPSWRSDGWERFPVGECGTCGSLTLLSDVDPGPYYAAYERHRPARGLPPSRRRRAVAAVAERTVATRLGGVFPVRRPEWCVWLGGSGLDRSAPVLDVGAGGGSVLADLARWGFRDLHGIDPWLPAPVRVADGVEIAVASVEDVDGRYDVVLLHDVLEHVDEPVAMLRSVAGLLAGRRSRVAVSLPVVEGEVWERYRDNWIALDVPVHRFLPTIEGMGRLAADAGLRVERVVRDCADYHLVGSERIARRIPRHVPDAEVFSPAELRVLRRDTARLRRRGRGPQATFVLRRAT